MPCDILDRNYTNYISPCHFLNEVRYFTKFDVFPKHNICHSIAFIQVKPQYFRATVMLI